MEFETEADCTEHETHPVKAEIEVTDTTFTECITELAADGGSHSTEKPQFCNKRFTTSTKLVHSRIHTGDRTYKCRMCDKAFSQSGHLNIHMRVHMGDKPYKCHMCDKAFSVSGSLNRHMRVHTGDKPYKCSLCNKRFSNSSTLQRHNRSYSHWYKTEFT